MNLLLACLRFRKVQFWLALFLISATSLNGQKKIADHPEVQESLQLLDVWMDAQQAYGRIPGASIAVVYDQELIWAKGYGYAHMEERIPATSSTMYSICSISKLFTAVGIMQLRDQDKLRLSDSVEDHLDWFSMKNDYSDSGPVTIEGILSHSSGLPREADAPYWTGPDYPFPTRDQIVSSISDQKMLYPARAHYQYSNLGLTLAGEILMGLTGQSYSDYVQNNILRPLGMEDTTTDHLDEFRNNQLATGYSAIQRDGTLATIPPYQVRGIAPAAGMLSTVEDLAKFASWQFRTLDGNTEQAILEKNTLREMQRVHFMEPDASTTYGLGFSVWRNDEKRFVGHGGSCPGYRSHFLVRPEDKIATIFMTNGQGVSAGNFTQIAFDILSPAIKNATEIPSTDVVTDRQTSKDLKRFAGLYKRPLGGETAVLQRGDTLIMLGLPSRNPLSSITELEHIEGNTFRRILSNDTGELGEEIIFEEVGNGEMKLWRHNNFSLRQH